MFTWPSSTAPRRPASESVQVGARADDAHLLGRVEDVGDLAHALAFGVPVEQHRVEDELLVLGQRHAGVLRAREDGVLGDHPRRGHRHRPLAHRQARFLQGSLALLGEVRALAGVLGRPDRDERVGLLPDAPLQRRRDAQRLERRGARERAADQLERHLEQRIGAAPRDLLEHRLDERPGERRRAHLHLPARLNAHRALDEQAGVVVDPGITHEREF